MVWVPLLDKPAVAPTSNSVITFENSYNTWYIIREQVKQSQEKKK